MNIVQLMSIIQLPENIEQKHVTLILKQGDLGAITTCDGQMSESNLAISLLLYCITDDHQVVKLFSKACSNLNILMN